MTQVRGCAADQQSYGEQPAPEEGTLARPCAEGLGSAVGSTRNRRAVRPGDVPGGGARGDGQRPDRADLLHRGGRRGQQPHHLVLGRQLHPLRCRGRAGRGAGLYGVGRHRDLSRRRDRGITVRAGDGIRQRQEHDFRALDPVGWRRQRLVGGWLRGRRPAREQGGRHPYRWSRRRFHRQPGGQARPRDLRNWQRHRECRRRGLGRRGLRERRPRQRGALSSPRLVRLPRQPPFSGLPRRSRSTRAPVPSTRSAPRAPTA